MSTNRSAAQAQNSASLPELLAEANIGPWEARVHRLADGSLQGVALIGGGSVRAGGDHSFLACRNKAWAVGFLGSYGAQWDRFVSTVEAGAFVDEDVNIPPEQVPLVLYKVGGGLPGRAEWRLGRLTARAAETLVLWIGMTKVSFQVTLGVAETARLLAGAPSGGELKVTLPDSTEPWLSAEFPPFADVMTFFLQHGCGRRP